MPARTREEADEMLRLSDRLLTAAMADDFEALTSVRDDDRYSKSDWFNAPLTYCYLLRDFGEG
jgi:hypothetical protein